MKKGILMSLLLSAMMLLPNSLFGQTQVTITGFAVNQQKTYDRTTNCTVSSDGTIDASTLDPLHPDVYINYTTAEYDDVNVGSAVGVTGYVYLEGDDVDYYVSPVEVHTTAAINPAPLNISSYKVDTLKVYDGLDTVHVAKNGSLAGTNASKAKQDGVGVITSAVYQTVVVGVNKVINVTFTLTGAKASNYTAPSAITKNNGVITAKQLTASAPTLSPSKVYDASDSCGVTVGSLIGVISPDNVTFTASAHYNNANVGNKKPVTVTYSITGDDAANYLAPADNDTLESSITPRPLSATATFDPQKEYDGTKASNTITSVTLGNVVTGDTLYATAEGTYDNKNVGDNKDITIQFTKSGDPNGNYSNLNDSVCHIGSITKRTTFLHDSTSYTAQKIYDGNYSVAVSSAGSLDSVILNDNVTLAATAAYTGRPDNTKVGTGLDITVNYSLTGADAQNYNAPEPLTFHNGVITAKKLTVANTTVVPSKEYDGLTTCSVSSKGTLTNLIAGDESDVTLLASASYLDETVANGKTVKVGYDIAGTKATNYIAPDTASLTADITPRRLILSSVTSDAKVYDGNTNVTVNVGAPTNLVDASSDVTVSVATAAFRDRHVGNGKPVDVHFSISGSRSSNYLAPNDTTINDGSITKRQVGVKNTTIVTPREYDGTYNAQVSVHGVLDTLYNSADQVTVTATATFSGKDVGTRSVYVNYTLSGNEAGNYLPSTSTLTGEITKRTIGIQTPATVTASKQYDNNRSCNVLTHGTLSGTIAGDVVSPVASAQYTDSCVGFGKNVIISYTLAGKNASNYYLDATTNDTAGITPRPLTVSGTTVTLRKPYDGKTSASSSAGQLSGILGSDIVSLKTVANYDSPAVGTNKDITVAYSLAGRDSANYYVTPADTVFKGGEIYDVKPYVEGTVVDSSKTYDGTDTCHVVAGTLVGVKEGDDVTLNATAKFEDAKVGDGKRVIVTYFLTGRDTAYYKTPAPDSTFHSSITPKQLTVSGTKVDTSRAYNAATDIVISESGTLVGVLSTDDVSITANALYADKNVGQNKDVIVSYSISGSDATNYSAPLNDTLSASITAIPLTVTNTIVAKTKPFDGNDKAAFTLGTIKGKLKKDDVSLSATATTATYDNANIGTGKNITLRYSLSGSDAGNYYLDPADTVYNDGEITKASLSVGGSTCDVSKTYDGTDTANVSNPGTMTGLIPGHSDVQVVTVAHYDSKNAGNNKTIYIIYYLTGTDTAYYSVPDPVTLNNGKITRDTVSISGATVSDKTYDGTNSAVVSFHGNVNGAYPGDSVAAHTIAHFLNTNAGSDSLRLVYSLVGPDSANYIVRPLIGGTRATITPLQLTLLRSADVTLSKTYDGNNSCSVTNPGTLSGLLPIDQVSLSADAHYDDEKVGTNKAIYVSYALSGPDTANYIAPLSDTLDNGEIYKAQVQLINTVVADKVYDGNTTATVTNNGNLVGVLPADSSLLSVNVTAVFDDKNVGSGKSVSLSYSLSGDEKDNYKLVSNQDVRANITAKTVHAHGAQVGDKPYDGKDYAIVTYNGTVDTIVTGDDVSVNASATFDNVNAGTRSATIIYSLTGAQAANYQLDSVTGSGSATINPLALTVGTPSVATSKVYDGDSTCSVHAGSLSGVLPGENVTLSAVGMYDDKNVGTHNITVTYSLGGSNASNYVLPQPYTTSGTITPASAVLTGTSVQPSRTYNADTTITITNPGSLQGILACDTADVRIGSLVASFADRFVGSNKPVNIYYTITGSMMGNYDIADNQHLHASITPDTLTVTGASVSPKTYDGTRAATVASAGTLNGVYPGDNVTLNTTALFDDVAVSSCQSATLTHTLTGADAANYVISPVTSMTCAAITSGTLTVSGTDPILNKTYDGSDTCYVNNPGTLGGVRSGDDVTLVAHANFNDKNAGSKSVTICYELTGDDAANYTAPACTTLTGTIDPLQLVLADSDIDSTKVYDGTRNANLSTPGSLSGILPGDNVTPAISALYDNKNVGTNKPVTVSCTLSGPDAGNYSVSSTATLLADITYRVLNVSGTIIDTTKVYDGNADANVITVGSLNTIVPGDIVTATAVARYDSRYPTNTANAIVIYSLHGADSANYYVAPDTIANCTIRRAPLTVGNFQVSNVKQYDGNRNATVTCGVASGIIGQDSITVTATGTYDTKNVGTNKDIVVHFTLSGDTAFYDVANNDTTLNNGEITVAPITISGLVVDTAKLFDGTDSAHVRTQPTPAVLPGDNVIVTATANFNDASVAQGKSIFVNYSMSGADAQNYIQLTQSLYSTNGHIYDIVELNPDRYDSTQYVTTNFSGYCSEDFVTLNYSFRRGEPSEYRIDFIGDAAKIFTNVNWRAFDSLTDSVEAFQVPANCADGDYYAVVQFRNEVNSSCLDTFRIHVNLSHDYITAIFYDVVSIVNVEERFHSYQWYRNDTIIPGANLPYYNEIGGLYGKYHVVVNLGESTENTVCPQYYDSIGYGEVSYITAYPNPVVEEVNVRLVNFPDGKHTLRIVTQMGLAVITETFQGDSYTLNLASLPSGTYTIIVDDKNVKVIKK